MTRKANSNLLPLRVWKRSRAGGYLFGYVIICLMFTLADPALAERGWAGAILYTSFMCLCGWVGGWVLVSFVALIVQRRSSGKAKRAIEKSVSESQSHSGD